MNKIKILFILPNLDAGGAERVLLNFTRTIDPQMNDISLVILNDSGDIKNYVPAHVKLININTKRTRHAFFKILKVARKLSPDFIFSTHNRINILSLSISFFLTSKIKIIIREPSSPKSQYGTKYLKNYYKTFSQILYHKAYKIIAQTSEMKNEIVDVYRVNKEKVIVVNNILDNAYIDKCVRNAINPFNNDKINIVASGRLHDVKGFDFLLYAFAKVIIKDDRFHLSILGKKEGHDNCTVKLSKQIQNLNLEDNVDLCGFQSNPYPYYQNADLFVLSSRWEGLPNVVLESQYLGTPVVATKCVPILNELIEDGVNGKLCDFGDVAGMAEAILDFQSYNQVSGRICDTDQIQKIFY